MNKPTLKLDVDLTNPGQFLACCGLLELASRVAPEAMGWFEEQTFHTTRCDWGLLERFIHCEVRPITAEMKTGPVTNVEEKSQENQKEEKSPPAHLGQPFDLLLDWWKDDSASEAGFKTWSAGMTIMGFFNGTTASKGSKQSPGMREHLSRHLPEKERLLQTTDAIEKPSPFNFDSRLSRNTAIDLGFTDGITFAFSPAVELLALVGLQRFRPRMISRWERNTYCTWREPLPASIAAAVVNGQIPTLTSNCYSFSVKPRDAQGRYKAFGPALLERNFDHE